MLSLDGRWCLVYAIVGYLAGGILFCDLLLRGLKRMDVYRAAEDGNLGAQGAFRLGGFSGAAWARCWATWPRAFSRSGCACAGWTACRRCLA